jgi:hypothetical protein
MQRTRVSSSNIASVGYDEVSRVLEVEFQDGRIYQYSDVPKSEYLGLMNAASHGKYLNEHIVQGGYGYAEV